ncbi:MAG: HYExAFE family protein [Phycisphaerales bacterium]|nr:HYExAFE family protein [Phycisphaerales bacterium]
MGRRQIHYERAFTAMLKERSVPYVAVDEARRAILPGEQAPLKTLHDGQARTLKAFDYVLYGTPNLLVELKGRRLPAGSTRLENWVTADDIDSLRRWTALFSAGGSGYTGCFVFVYECAAEPPTGASPLFDDCWIYKDRWYALRTIDVEAYAAHMKVRSARWRTMNLPKAEFERLSGPLLGREAVAHA